jgi:creatinine amidohydrolase
VSHAASKLVELIKEVDAFDVACFFNQGEPGRYCGVSLRRVWDDDGVDGPKSDGKDETKSAKTKSAYASHYTGKT